jgi:hypothetical protein
MGKGTTFQFCGAGALRLSLVLAGNFLMRQKLTRRIAHGRLSSARMWGKQLTRLHKESQFNEFHSFFSFATRVFPDVQRAST